jgi:hypothetical protein
MVRRTLLWVGWLLAVWVVAATGPALATDCTISPDWKVASVRLPNAGGGWSPILWSWETLSH